MTLESVWTPDSIENNHTGEFSLSQHFSWRAGRLRPDMQHTQCPWSRKPVHAHTDTLGESALKFPATLILFVWKGRGRITWGKESGVDCASSPNSDMNYVGNKVFNCVGDGSKELLKWIIQSHARRSITICYKFTWIFRTTPPCKYFI